MFPPSVASFCRTQSEEGVRENGGFGVVVGTMAENPHEREDGGCVFPVESLLRIGTNVISRAGRINNVSPSCTNKVKNVLDVDEDRKRPRGDSFFIQGR